MNRGTVGFVALFCGASVLCRYWFSDYRAGILAYSVDLAIGSTIALLQFVLFCALLLAAGHGLERLATLFARRHAVYFHRARPEVLQSLAGDDGPSALALSCAVPFVISAIPIMNWTGLSAFAFFASCQTATLLVVSLTVVVMHRGVDRIDYYQLPRLLTPYVIAFACGISLAAIAAYGYLRGVASLNDQLRSFDGWAFSWLAPAVRSAFGLSLSQLPYRAIVEALGTSALLTLLALELVPRVLKRDWVAVGAYTVALLSPFFLEWLAPLVSGWDWLAATLREMPRIFQAVIVAKALERGLELLRRRFLPDERCPHCEGDLQLPALFCPYCGKPVSIGSATAK